MLCSWNFQHLVLYLLPVETRKGMNPLLFSTMHLKIHLFASPGVFSLKLWEDCCWENDGYRKMNVNITNYEHHLLFLQYYHIKIYNTCLSSHLESERPPVNFWQLKEGQIQLRSENFFVWLVPEVANGILWRAAGNKTRGNLIKALYNKIITITARRQRRSPFNSQGCKFKWASSHCDVKPLTCHSV